MGSPYLPWSCLQAGSGHILKLPLRALDFLLNCCPGRRKSSARHQLCHEGLCLWSQGTARRPHIPLGDRPASSSREWLGHLWCHSCGLRPCAGPDPGMCRLRHSATHLFCRLRQTACLLGAKVSLVNCGEKDNSPVHRRARSDSISGSDFYGGIHFFSPQMIKMFRKSGKHRNIRTVTMTCNHSISCLKGRKWKHCFFEIK